MSIAQINVKLLSLKLNLIEMATNKQALLRYKTIDQCLQNRLRKWTLEDLMDAVADALYNFEGKETGIGKRTIQQDIQVMRSNTLGYNAPIIVKDKKYYSYEEKDYSISKAQMNPADLSKLKEIVQVLRQFSAFSYFDDMSELIIKLEDNIQVTAAQKQNYVQFESNPLLKGLAYIDPLFQAINKRQTLNIKYKSFKAREAREGVYFPYLLKEYRNRWFVIVKSTKGRQIIILALDRIEGITPNDTVKFQQLKGQDWDSFFSDVIGVTKTESDKAMAIIFEVQAAHASYIVTKPLHASQTILKQDEISTIFKINVVLNFELERELLGFGEYLKVLSPRLLKKKISGRIGKMHEQYL